MRTYRQVLEPEPQIAEFLARHADRLINPQRSHDVPRGLWVCEENGAPILALVAYTEPYLRLSAIVDKPESRPFTAIINLAKEFETWGAQIGGSGYAVTVENGDEHWRYLLEGYGAIPVNQNSAWTEFYIPFEKTPNTDNGIRSWEPLDWHGLKPLVRAYLFESFSDGSPIVPTTLNMNRFLSHGMLAARNGEPLLVGIDDHKIVAFAGILKPQSQYDLTEGYGLGLGTYVHPNYRRRSWATRIRNELLVRAKEFGYTRITGAAYTLAGLKSSKAIGMKEQAVLVTKVL